MRNRYQFAQAVLAVLLVALVAACAQSQVRTGFVGSQTGARAAFRYQTFRGLERYAVDVPQGQKLAIDYQVTVSKGSLVLEVQDAADKTVQQVALPVSTSGQVEVPAEQGGRYHIVVQGKDAGGSFELSWQVKGS